MNKREKILASVVGGVAALFVGGGVVRSVILGPMEALDKQYVAVEKELRKEQDNQQKSIAAQTQLEQWNKTAFADNAEMACATAGQLLTRHILAAGLADLRFTRNRIETTTIKNVGQEVGWTVNGQGPLENVVHLLYILRNDPHLTRIENLVIAPTENRQEVAVRFRYLTMTLDKMPPIKREAPAYKPDLADAGRLQYATITRRDMFRPYIKRVVPPPVVVKQDPAPPPPPPPPAGPGPETFKIISLSEWRGATEVHLRDLTKQKTLLYAPGDKLADGVIVMVDYRPMPMPGKPLLVSDSRVILRVGEEFWAIERGQTLANKRKLTAEQLPVGLLEKSAK